MITTEQVQITVTRYRGEDGQPTCDADAAQYVCEFLYFVPDDNWFCAKIFEPLRSLRPAKDCPIWKGVER